MPARAVAASSRGPISARAARRYQRSSAGRGSPAGHEQHVAAAVDAGAARLGHEGQRLAEVRHGAGRARHLGGRAGERPPPARDPRRELLDRLGGGALRRAARQRDGDAAVRVDGDPHAAGARERRMRYSATAIGGASG